MMTMKGSSPARSWVMVNTFYEFGRLGPGVTQKRTTEVNGRTMAICWDGQHADHSII